MSTPPMRLAQNSCKLSDSGSFPDMPAITTSSMLLPAGPHSQLRPQAGGSARSLATCSLAPASTCSANPANPAACRVSSGPAGPHFSLGPGSPHHSPAAGGLPSIWWPAAGSLGTPAISLRAGPVNRAAGGETAQRCEGRKPPPTDRPPRTRCPRLPPTAPCPNLGDPGGELGHHGCQGSALQRANLENLSWSGVRQVLPRATHLCR